MKAVGFHVIVKKNTVETGDGLIVKETRYELVDRGPDISSELPDCKYVIIRHGAEGDPFLRGKDALYIVHIDNVLAVED